MSRATVTEQRLRRGRVILSDTDEMEEDDEYDSDVTNISSELISDHEGPDSSTVGAGEGEGEDTESELSLQRDHEQSPVLERRFSNSQVPHQYITRFSRRQRILTTTTDSEESQASAMSLERQNPGTPPEPPGEPPPESNWHPPPNLSPQSQSLSSQAPSPNISLAESSSHPISSLQQPQLLASIPSPGLSSLQSSPQIATSSGAGEGTTRTVAPQEREASPILFTMEPMNTTPPKKCNPAPAIPSTPESEDEGQMCTICFEPWSNSGTHRLASLKCGHLFGRKCIERWLKGPNGKCPQCNAKATKKNIRVLFAKSLKVLDTTERDRVLQDLEKERESKKRLQVEYAQTKLKYELKTQLVVKLQEELRMMRNATAGMNSSQGYGSSTSGEGRNNGKFRLVMHSGVDIIKDGGCRVMAYNEWLSMLVVSMPSQVAMFSGFGVKKVNILDMKPDRYVPLHQKQIRDMAFNPVKHDLLLSVAMDKVVKLTNICSNTTVASFQTESPLWSCCWNADEANQFFVGTAGGLVLQYNTNNTLGPERTITVAGSGPVVSLSYVPFSCNANFNTGGLLVARLQSCSFVEVKEDGAQFHTLPLEGPFTSLSLETSTRHVLVSCRPSQRFPHARHLICELKKVNISTDLTVINNVVTANTVHTFQGGTTQKVLSRSCATVNPTQAGSVLACASDESTQSTCVWDLATTSCLQQIRCPETVIDILSIKSNQYAFLALLTDKSVKFYKWIDVL